jgi:hypothetical protein
LAGLLEAASNRQLAQELLQAPQLALSREQLATDLDRAHGAAAVFEPDHHE